MTLQLHRPDGQGGLVPTRPSTERRDDWRKNLQSPRWRAARLANPDLNPTSTPVAIAFWVGLAAVTLVLLLVGYGSNFWH
jgi:hypothetical protein